MTNPFTVPLGADIDLDLLVRGLASIADNQQRVEILGQKDTGTGTDVDVRFRASRATLYVQVHVQSDAVGKGGADYDAANFMSSSRVDCRSSRLQDQTISRNGTDQYFLFLIPVFLEGDRTTYTKFDGVDGADEMAFLDLGT